MKLRPGNHNVAIETTLYQTQSSSHVFTSYFDQQGPYDPPRISLGGNNKTKHHRSNHLYFWKQFLYWITIGFMSEHNDFTTSIPTRYKSEAIICSEDMNKWNPGAKFRDVLIVCMIENDEHHNMCRSKLSLVILLMREMIRSRDHSIELKHTSSNNTCSITVFLSFYSGTVSNSCRRLSN